MRRNISVAVLVCLMVLGLARGAPAQVVTGSITTSSTGCTVQAACVSLPLTLTDGALALTVSGTFSATLQFEATVSGIEVASPTWVAISGDPMPSGSRASSTTATGTWAFNVAGFGQFRVRASAYTSGTASIAIRPSPASAKTRSIENLALATLNNVRYCDQFPGATAGAKIVAAIADLPTTGGVVDCLGLEGAQTISQDIFTGVTKPVTLLLGAATYTASVTQNIETENISIIGLGPSQTAITSTVNGDLFRVKLSTWNGDMAGQIAGVKLNGNANANGVGIHIGDIVGFGIRNVWIADFTGTNGAGIWFDNTTNWTERTVVDDVWLDSNKIGMRFTVNGGTNSFLYNTFRSVRMNLDANQTGVKGENDSSVNGSMLDIIINHDDAGSTAISFALTGTSAWSNNLLNVHSEDTGGGGGTGWSLASGTTLGGVGIAVMADLTNTISGTLNLQLTDLASTAGTAVVYTPYTISSFLASNRIGSHLLPQLGTDASFHHGLGLNLRFDGTNWITEGDGASNGGAAILGEYGAGTGIYFYVVPSTAGTDQSISDATLESTHKRASLSGTGLFKTALYGTNTNCSDSAGDAACAAAPAGSFVVDAADTNTVVSTTAVTADSQIFLQIDASLGTRLSVTCNTQAASTFNPRVTARTAGTSFTVTVDAGPTTNPLCMSYMIVN